MLQLHQPHHESLFLCLVPSPCVSLFSPLPHLLTAFACGPVCPDSLFFLSPFHSHAVATVCSPGTPPGSLVTTYVSFCDGLTVHGENCVPFVLTIFTSDNAIPDKALAPAAMLLRFKNGYGSYMTHTVCKSHCCRNKVSKMINEG